jgi:amino acid permease
MKYSLLRKCWTYTDLLEDAYPAVGRLALQIAVIINNTGILVVYLIIVGEVSRINARTNDLFSTTNFLLLLLRLSFLESKSCEEM